MQVRSLSLLLIVAHPIVPVQAQSWVDTTLTRLESAYEGTQRLGTVEGLVHLDSALRGFVTKINMAYPANNTQFWEDRYARLGLYIDHYSDLFDYSGKFLVEAHALNPCSPLRDHTLFSTLLGLQEGSSLAQMPDLDSARQYISEFPSGPYAEDAYEIIGDFYKDLYMVLRDCMRGYADYKYECFKQFIDATPIDQQRERTQKLAIDYYERAMKVNPTDTDLPDIIARVRAGTVTSWTYCAD